MRWRSSLLLPFLILSVTAVLGGCNTIARSQGKFPVADSFGPDTVGPSGFPNDPDLFVPQLELQPNGQLDSSKRVPLVKVAYRTPWGDLINTPENTHWDQQSTYIVIDVSNVLRDPTLGTTDEPIAKKRLEKVAIMILNAADHNGDVFWRHLTTFLETYKAANSAARAAAGAAIAAAFISPVLAAGLAGGALTTDTFVTDFTSSLNVDEYAALREATSTYRKKVKGEILESIRTGPSGAAAVNSVLHQAYDYAFSYSIKGAIYAAAKENAELKTLLITGDSPWKRFFQDEALEFNKQKLKDSKAKGGDTTQLQALIDAEEAQAKADREHQAALETERRAQELAAAQAKTAEEQLRKKKAEDALKTATTGTQTPAP